MGGRGSGSRLTLTLKESSALYSYTGSEFRDINNYLRTGEGGSAELKDRIANIDKALNKSPVLKEDIVIYRGVPENVLQDLKVGDIYRDKGYASGALGEDIYWDNATLIINANAGTKPGRDITGNSFFFDIEKEFLLKRNIPIRITDKRRNGNRLIVEGRYIGR